jgi:hypothetical protein
MRRRELGEFVRARGWVALALCICALMVSSCAPRAPRPPPPPAYFTHEILYRGETLSVIASWYTGASQNWREIAAANPELNPLRLKPGMEIRIPRALVVRQDALPKSVVDAAFARTRAAATEKEAEAGSTETPGAPQQVRVTPPGLEPDGGVGTEGTTGLAPKLPDPDQPSPDRVREVSGAEAVPSGAAAGAANVDPSQARQKTRDQLLKELLEDY